MDDLELDKNVRDEIRAKLREYFNGKIVRKDLTKKIKEGANVPVYVLEYLLGQYCNSEDEEIIQDGVETVKKYSHQITFAQMKRRKFCLFFVNRERIRLLIWFL